MERGAGIFLLLAPHAQHLAKLFQETQIVTEEIANVVDAVFQHGNTLRPHAEGKPAKYIGIIATIAEHLGVHHTGSENLQPPTLLTDRAALATADDAVHIDLDAGLGKGEMAATKPYLAVRTKHAGRSSPVLRLRSVQHQQPHSQRRGTRLVLTG